MITYLERWKKTLPEMPEVNFDNNADLAFEELKDLEPYIYRKILNNTKIVDDLFPIIFPKGTVLYRLTHYFSSKDEPIYNNLARLTTDILHRYL